MRRPAAALARTTDAGADVTGAVPKDPARTERSIGAIETVYSTALEPSRWPAALQAIADVTEDVGAVLVFARDDGRFGAIQSPRLDDLLREFRELSGRGPARHTRSRARAPIWAGTRSPIATLYRPMKWKPIRNTSFLENSALNSAPPCRSGRTLTSRPRFPCSERPRNLRLTNRNSKRSRPFAATRSLRFVFRFASSMPTLAPAWTQALARVRVLLLVVDPKANEPFDPGIVRDLLGVTLGEARIASLIAAGLTARETGTKLGVTTRRSQIAHRWRSGAKRSPEPGLWT
jgi:hypothetical protein